jgi:hypothetical protein
MAGSWRGLGLELPRGGEGLSEDLSKNGGFMDKQVFSQGGVWFSYGLVLLIMLVAVVGAALRDARLANAAAKEKPK